MEDRKTIAERTFDSGFNCAQSVLTAFCDRNGLDKERALEVAAAFGGGMGGMGRTCGAVTGGLMAIGVKHGRSNVHAKEAKAKISGLAQTFASRFAAIHGSVECRDLLACDISQPEERLRAQEENLFKTLCPKYVTSAVEMVNELLMDTMPVYEDVLKSLAPCGLNCSTCLAFSEGDIGGAAWKLRGLLGSFDAYAERFSKGLPVFKNYLFFKELLRYFSDAGCKGCRQGACGHPNCGVVPCSTEKGLDFCFQCHQFPCDKTNFDPGLKEQWFEINSRMKEIGAETYYKETRNLPRYR